MAHLLTASGSLSVLKELWEDEDDVEGFDTGVLRRTVRASSSAAARGLIAHSANPPGSVGGFGAMYCVHRRARKVVCGLYETEHHFRGILNAGSKPFKVQARGYSEKQSTSAGVYPGQGANVPLESNQGLVGITVHYPALTAPTLAISGSNASPPVSVTAPDNIWDSIANPIHTYPYGWVLDAREYENIPGSNIVLVTDQYVYYQRYKPGN